tara:strand:+ start:348 stop:752 length:405 start_codon:yes stop_codon:yes gene_type:complete
MKKTIASVVACLAMSGPAATMADEDTIKNADNLSATAQATMHSPLATMDIDELEGMDIYDSDGAQLGDVDEVVKNVNNEPMFVIGLEDDTKEVVVPMEKLALASDGTHITTTMTRAELLEMKDYDPLDMESVDE